jgi:gliding motility-associated-like protein
MKHFYSYLHTILILLCLFFTNQSIVLASKAAPDNSIDISIDKPSICEGETISIFLATSEIGVEYQLKENGSNFGLPADGTGSQISFNLSPLTTATYSVTATNKTTNETSDLSETIPVTVNPGPNLGLSVNATENQICKGEGVIISVDNAELGYNYLLNNGPDDFPPAKAGNGSTISFQQVFPKANTTYRIFVSGGSCHDQIMLTNTATINVDAPPKTNLKFYSDNNQICPGESVTITIEKSEPGAEYQIFDGSTYVAGPLAGTGNNLNFSLSPTSSELYTIRAFGPNCLSYYNFDPKLMVAVGTTPRTDINLTADKSEVCMGEMAIISLEESESGVEYQLTDGTNPVGIAITGNGSSISFPGVSPTVGTTYHVEINSTQCSEIKDLDNTITINVSPQPDISLNVSPNNASICGGESISIFVDATENNVNYQLYDGISVVDATAGDGGTIEFIVAPTATTNYTVQAIKNTCTTINTLNQKANIIVNNLPVLDVILSAAPGEICEGESTIISIENSENGIQYQLKDASGSIGVPVSGTGGRIEFPALNPTTSTNYMVDAIKSECSSVYEILNQANVIVNPQPAASVSYLVNPSAICEGEVIVVSISGSENGIKYDVIGSLDGVLGSAEGNGTDVRIYIKPTQSQTLSIQAQNLLCSSSVLYSNTSNITVNSGPNLDLNVNVSEAQICNGLNTPVVVSVENSEAGLSYWLKNHTGTVIDLATGNNGTLNFSTVSPNTTTTYIVETTMAGCNDRLNLKNTVELNVIPLPLTNIAVDISEPEICVGENTIISIDSSEIGVSYQLFDGTYPEGDPIVGTGSALSFPEFSPFRSITYQVVATNKACGTQQNLDENIKVDVGLQPEIHLHPTIDKHTICEGEQVVISLTPTDTKVQYQLWNGDVAIGAPITGNNEEISFEPTNPPNSTTYRIEALGERCLAPIDIRYTVDVDVHHTPEINKLVIGSRDTVCAGEEVIISVENSQANIFYQLHNGTSLLEPNIVGNGSTIQFVEQYPNTTSVYSVYAHETVCTNLVQLNNSKQIIVPDISTNSVENFATPDEICEGETIDIELTNSIQGIKYVLQDGDDFISEITGDGGPIVFEDIVPSINSNLYVSVGNCIDKLVAATPAYTLQSNPKLQILTTDVQSGYDGNLVISVSNGVAPYTYVINPGETVTSDNHVLELTGLEMGTYQVLVVDGNACRSSEAGQLAQINLDEDLQVIVNNALTPNGDGVNDKWKIHYNSSLGNPEVYVFNIYGQEVYHSKTYQNDWRGTYNGSILPNGAYYYLIEFESEEIKPIKGSLSILGN